MRRSNSSDTWVAQTAWNGDVLDGTGTSGVTLDPTKGNVYKIQYQWLGFGTIKFYVGDPNNGYWILAHTIQYANANTSTTIVNPSLQIMAACTNATNTTNITLRVASLAAFVEGKIRQTDNVVRNSIFNNNASIASGSMRNILTIQNKSTYQSVNNRVEVLPDYLTIMETTGGTQGIRVSLYLNPTVAGTPSFTDISTNTSVVSYDIAGTTVTGGKVLISFFSSGIATDKQAYFDLKDFSIVLQPGDRLVVAAIASGGTNTIYAGLSWVEKF
jgi:hypothetical protein